MSQFVQVITRQELLEEAKKTKFYFFIKDKVWVIYEHILADIMEHAYALANEFGLKIYEQYPEQ